MGIRITTLNENTSGRPDVLSEWGLSILVETDDIGVLMDAGASITVSHNADLLGIDLRKISKIVLSHGHFDHSGGLQLLLGKMKHEVEIIAHPNIFASKYYHKENKPDRYIGLPYQMQLLESLGARFNFSRIPVSLTGNVMTTGEIPLITDFEKIESNLFIKTEEGWKPDSLLDDQALLVKSQLGLIVILGCAHRGIINTLYQARKVAGLNKIHMVLGGSHLIEAPDEQIWQTISALNEMGVKKLGVSHCTGMHATLLLAQTYGEDFIFNNTGNIINLN